MGSVVVCECGYNKLIFRVRPTVSHRTRTQAQRCAQGLEGSHPTAPNAPQASKQASEQEEQMEHSRLTGDMPLRAYTLVTPPLLKQILALASRGVMLVLHPPKTCLTSRLTTPDRHLPQALKKQDRVAPRALKTPSYASKQDSNRGGPSAQVRRLFMHGRRRDRLIGASRTRHVQRRSNSAHNRAACEHRASGRQEGRKSGAEIRTS